MILRPHGKQIFHFPVSSFYYPVASLNTRGASLLPNGIYFYCRYMDGDSIYMLAKINMQEIQDLKLQEYTKAKIIAYYKAHSQKAPSKPTINKYYDMNVIPDDPSEKLTKEKSFDVRPFKSAIITILETNSTKNYCMSSVYDVLKEKFIENGDYEKLPSNDQTLQNYIYYLEDHSLISREKEHRSTGVFTITYSTRLPANRC